MDLLVQEGLAGHYRIERRDLVGVAATCLTTESQATLCLSPEGVPLLTETPSLSIRAVRYAGRVDRSRFRLPAAPR